MGFLDTVKTFVAERRIGFRIDETMTGTHQFLQGKGPAGTHPMEFRVTWGHDHAGTWINPFGDQFMVSVLDGKIDVGGLAVDADCEGALELKYFTEAKIRYTFEFEDETGKRYEYVGEKKNLRPWNLHKTHTTCYGRITDLDSGEVISEGVVYFRLSTLLKFLASFKLA